MFDVDRDDRIQPLHDRLLASYQQQTVFVEEFGRYMATLRRRAGYTQAQLARQLHVSRSAIAQMESAHGVLGVRVLYTALAVLGGDPQSWLGEAADGMQPRPTQDTTSREALVAWLKRHIPIFLVMEEDRHSTEGPRPLPWLGLWKDISQWPEDTLRAMAAWLAWELAGTPAALRALVGRDQTGVLAGFRVLADWDDADVQLLSQVVAHLDARGRTESLAYLLATVSKAK